MSESELSSRVGEINKELMKLYSQVSTGTVLKKPMQVRELKRNVARINTILQERKSQSSTDGGIRKA
ncbi:50S ribosomal protein L29 [Candidatus Woesearchaeota archaeon]|nr:50S ribosomal protein L29 [Candidatus Woesearchaeota archaeon]